MGNMMRVVSLVVLAFSTIGLQFQAQTRDAAAVLAEMRQALGGAATLDAITSLSVRGTVRQTIDRFTKNFSTEFFFVLPDRFLEVRRDTGGDAPVPLDITYYNGFRGDTPIRRTDSSEPMPPDPVPGTPAVAAQWERALLLVKKQVFARVSLILFGRAFDSYPMQFDYVGVNLVDGRNVDVIEASAADGYKMRLSVDAVTHLPVAISYLAAQPFVFTTSSIVTVQDGRVTSESGSSPLPKAPAPGSLPIVEHRLVPSNFRLQDGLNWPRKFREEIGGKVVSSTDLGKFQINPSIKPSRFEVGR